MADRTKVDKGLERCLSGKVPFGCGKCPYYGDEVYTDAWSCRLSLMRDANELLKEQEWIPISERLPENAEHPGAFCPKVRVLTVWGESYGWYNPDVKAWYFLEWYMDSSREHLDFERGDYPGISYTPRNTNLITHWKPIP